VGKTGATESVSGCCGTGARGLKRDLVAGKDAPVSSTGCGVGESGARGLKRHPPVGKDEAESRIVCSARWTASKMVANQRTVPTQYLMRCHPSCSWLATAVTRLITRRLPGSRAFRA
jgi:hypothetical protein